MNNTNRQNDLMNAFGIEQRDNFVDNNFKKISLNIAQNGGSLPKNNDIIDFHRKNVEPITGTVIKIDEKKKFMEVSLVGELHGAGQNTTKIFNISELNPGQLASLGQQYDFILDDSLEAIRKPAIGKSMIYHIYKIVNNDLGKTIRKYSFPKEKYKIFTLTDKIFNFPSLYMWIPIYLWDGEEPNDKRLSYDNNYKKHQDILAVQKELAKNDFKIPYKHLYLYLKYINNIRDDSEISSKDIEVIINGIVNLIEIREGLMKTFIEKREIAKGITNIDDPLGVIIHYLRKLQSKESRRIKGQQRRFNNPISRNKNTKQKQPNFEQMEEQMESFQTMYKKMYDKSVETLKLSAATMAKTDPTIGNKTDDMEIIGATQYETEKEELKKPYHGKLLTYDEFVTKRGVETGNLIDPNARDILEMWNAL